MAEAGATTTEPSPGRRKRSWVRRELRMALEVVGLTGLVVTQPVLSIFQGSPDVFVIRRAEPVDVVLFAVLVALVPALVLWLIGALVGLAGDGPRRVAHVATLGGLGGLLVLLVVGDLTSLGPAVSRALAAAGGVAAGVLAWRQPMVRLLCRYLAAGSIVFVGVFLFASPATPVVTAGQVDIADPGVPPSAPVLLLVLDEFPVVSLLDGNGRVDEARFPAFAELAGDATWYRNHSTVAGATPTAVPAILTGKLPEPGAVPVASAHPDNLFTAFAGSYDVRATESLTQLCPPDVCVPRVDVPTRTVTRGLLGTATDLWRARLSPSQQGAVELTVSDQWFDPQSPERLAEFAPSLGVSGDRPRLDFLHVLLPHQPWDTLPTGEEYEAPNPPPGAPFLNVWADEHAAAVAQQRHLLQLQYVDRQLGRVIDRLRELGTYDETLIAVTADHGASFADGSPVRALSTANAPDVMWTPFFLKAPGQDRGEVIDTPMQSIDDLPTIAAALDVELPYETDGTAGGTGDVGDGPDERLMLDDEFNETHPPEGEDFLVVDGIDAFASVLDTDPLGSGSDELALYRIGPDADLIGRDTGGLGRSSPLGGEARITTVGAYVAGTMSGVVSRRVALVVDDTIVAAPRLYDDGSGVDQFFAMVPPAWRTDDPADISVFVIDGRGVATTLGPIPVSVGG